jgi:hypothetical protein
MEKWTKDNLEITADEVEQLLDPSYQRDQWANLAELDLPDGWTLGPTLRHRDSALLECSNADAIVSLLKDDTSCEDQWEIRRLGHFGYGWKENIIFQVLKDGEPTAAFWALKEIEERLSNYPVLDEDDYSMREYEATLDNIEAAGRRFVRDDARDGWESDAFGWFSDNNQGAIESRDDQGGCPSDDEMIECLEALGLLDSERDDLYDL